MEPSATTETLGEPSKTENQDDGAAADLEFTEEELEELLFENERWTIFEDIEDEVRYLRRRGEVLARAVHNARAEIDHLHEAGMQLQEAHEALQDEVREVAGDAAYWRALAEARTEELAAAQATLASLGACTGAATAPSSPLATIRRPASPGTSSRRPSLPGALWGASGTSRPTSVPPLPMRAVDREEQRQLQVEQENRERNVELSKVVTTEKTEAKVKESNVEQSIETPTPRIEDLREALRQAAAEAAAAAARSTRRRVTTPASDELQSQSQLQLPIQARSSETSATTASAFFPPQRLSLAIRPGTTVEATTAAAKVTSLGAPVRLSAASRSRRESIITKTPPRHRTPPSHFMLSRSPSTSGSLSPLALSKLGGGISAGIRRALFSPSSGFRGSKNAKATTRTLGGLGTPSRRKSRLV